MSLHSHFGCHSPSVALYECRLAVVSSLFLYFLSQVQVPVALLLLYFFTLCNSLNDQLDISSCASISLLVLSTAVPSLGQYISVPRDFQMIQPNARDYEMQ
ncbi:hypothetical protein BKA93DRAFT_365543 [Sparassis latifolia]